MQNRRTDGDDRKGLDECLNDEDKENSNEKIGNQPNLKRVNGDNFG